MEEVKTSEGKNLVVSPELVERLKGIVSIEAEYEGKMWRVQTITPIIQDTIQSNLSVKLPNPRDARFPQENQGKSAEGWNACLKEVERLNK